ncbi:MAG: helicase [Gammaproteobacteria bacterium]|nr:MAG: helicase [Gammaproteobacteria bacterium]
MDITNPELQLANDFIKYTGNNIFLTGKAGTGKTTFLHKLKENTPKRMIITAPTGVAAINAGGVTLHSFFQMPFGPFVPGDEIHQQRQRHRFSKEKVNIIKSLDLLVIDEISMVRADLLDAVDAVLRRYKHQNQPFGGVQLLMIGDLHQLPPVVKDDEWNLLKQYYDSFYFFSSNALRQTQMISIELKHIYRQSDAHFIQLLNRVRDNRLDQETLEALNARYKADFQADEKNNYITLTTHNRSADNINEKHLQKLDSKSFVFQADIEGDYPEYIYPAAEKLTLKKGAQVMFVRNDSSAEKLYFNGKIGKITQIDKQSISVKCPDEKSEIQVERADWENIKYALDPESKEISEQVLGTFCQFPLRLAWAITIHKSQGLTFEHAIIDANAAFSHGQVYVALSRCKTFEGMVLSTPITQRAVKTDRTVARFVEHASQYSPGQEQLNSARIHYQQKLLLACFDYQALHLSLKKLSKLLSQNLKLIQFSGFEMFEKIEKQTLDEIIIVSDKFNRQLQSLFADNKVPEDDAKLQQRVQKASHYFTEKLQSGLLEWLAAFNVDSDNKEIIKQINQGIGFLRHTLDIKMAGLQSCQDGFSTGLYLNALALAEIDSSSNARVKKSTPDYHAADVEHPELLQILKLWRAEQAEEQGVAHYQILHQQVLIHIANKLPDTLAALLKIKGVGKYKVEKYGAQLTAMVVEYLCNN